MSLVPSMIVIRSYLKNREYLRFIKENDKFDGYLEFSEVVPPNTFSRFQVELPTDESAKADNLVHIRSYENRKYLVRTQNLSITNNPAEQYWITATADDAEEDQSKENCTLFKFINVDYAMKTARIIHVQSGCYLCLWGLSWKDLVLANYKDFDHQSMDIFTIIDWEPINLPKYVALKGDNGKYLCVRQIDDKPYLQFVTDEIGDPTVPCQIIAIDDGNIYIVSSSAYWRLDSSNWILADFIVKMVPPADCMFRPVPAYNGKMALVNLANNNFCKRLTDGAIESCLSASLPYIDDYAQLTVDEPVQKREIYDVNYNLDLAQIYDRDLVVANNSITNNSQVAITTDVKLSYKNTRLSTWDNYISIRLGVRPSFDIKNFPIMFMGKLKVVEIIQREVMWRVTKSLEPIIEVIANEVVVPPKTKVTVNLHATVVNYEVPFSCTQKDTLYDGSIIEFEVKRATYYGTNYYNFNFEIIEEKLN